MIEIVPPEPASIASPCVNICQIDQATGWCLGCGRTVPEIRAWRKMTPYRRTALARELPRRIEQMASAGQRLSRFEDA